MYMQHLNTSAYHAYTYRSPEIVQRKTYFILPFTKQKIFLKFFMNVYFAYEFFFSTP